jgi:hypothetical protein
VAEDKEEDKAMIGYMVVEPHGLGIYGGMYIQGCRPPTSGERSCPLFINKNASPKSLLVLCLLSATARLTAHSNSSTISGFILTYVDLGVDLTALTAMAELHLDPFIERYPFAFSYINTGNSCIPFHSLPNMISFIAAEPVSTVFLFSTTYISSTSLAQGVIRQLALAHTGW